jgi:hypothetical protein
MSGDSLKHAHVHPEFALSVELVHPRLRGGRPSRKVVHFVVRYVSLQSAGFADLLGKHAERTKVAECPSLSASIYSEIPVNWLFVPGRDGALAQARVR